MAGGWNWLREGNKAALKAAGNDSSAGPAVMVVPRIPRGSSSWWRGDGKDIVPVSATTNPSPTPPPQKKQKCSWALYKIVQRHTVLDSHLFIHTYYCADYNYIYIYTHTFFTLTGACSAA